MSDADYLRGRIAQVFDTKPASHRPRWTLEDARAVRALLDVSTSGEKPVDELLASPRGPFDMVEAE